MFCEMCGRKLEEGNTFCPYCGHKLAGPCYVQAGNVSVSKAADEESIFGGGLPDSQTFDYPSQPVRDNGFDGYSYGNVSQDYENSAPADVPQTKKKKGGGTAAMVIVTIIAILVVGAGVFYFVTDGKFFDSDIFNKENASDAAVDKNASGGVHTNENSPVDSNDSQTGTLSSDGVEPDRHYNEVDYYVNVASATIYKGPDANSYKVVCTVTKDEALTVKGGHTEHSDWVYVYCKRTNDYGWISVALISDKTVSDIDSTQNSTGEVIYYDVGARFNVTITVGEGHNLNLRRHPDTTDPDNVILLIPDLSVATVLGVSSTDNKWYYVEYSDIFGTYYGFIYSEHTTR